MAGKCQHFWKVTGKVLSRDKKYWLIFLKCQYCPKTDTKKERV